VQRLEMFTKVSVVIHHSQPELLGDPALMNHTRPRKYSAWAPVCQSVAKLRGIGQNLGKFTGSDLDTVRRPFLRRKGCSKP
jgi:hypothetical protein